MGFQIIRTRLTRVTNVITNVNTQTASESAGQDSNKCSFW